MLSIFFQSTLLAFVCSVAILPAQTTPPAASEGSVHTSLIQTEPIERIGKDGVSAPILLVAPAPKFPKDARKKRISGRVLVDLLVEADGQPSHVHVLEGLGFGLDEKAIEAVSAYKFKPSMKDGIPVRVEMHVEVNFKIY